MTQAASRNSLQKYVQNIKYLGKKLEIKYKNANYKKPFIKISQKFYSFKNSVIITLMETFEYSV